MAGDVAYETHEHDVIVIGAGGAGMRAAIEASALGARLSRAPVDFFSIREFISPSSPSGRPAEPGGRASLV